MQSPYGVTSKGELPDGTVAQHRLLVQMNEQIREETGEAYLTQTVHDGQHKYFFTDSDYAVRGIRAALEHMETRWHQVFPRPTA